MKQLHELTTDDLRAILFEAGYMTEDDEFLDSRFVKYNDTGKAVYIFEYPASHPFKAIAPGQRDKGYVYVWALWDDASSGKIVADF